jgi:hypothetical protein
LACWNDWVENAKDQERRTMSDDNTRDAAEPSSASAGSHGMDVSVLLDAIGDCLAQVDPFDQRCVVVLNTPERRQAHKAFWQLKRMAESSCMRLLPEERAAIEVCAAHWKTAPASKVLLGLLERLG